MTRHGGALTLGDEVRERAQDHEGEESIGSHWSVERPPMTAEISIATPTPTAAAIAA